MPPTGTIGKWVECGGESWKSAHLWSIWSKTEVGAADWNATNFCIKIAQGEGVAQWVEENENGHVYNDVELMKIFHTVVCIALQ
ncbi:hypothetical protein T03_6412 [Trichinella britovi]|uniref:Uncharacterized protein n=1 Tax=Trichinella britovi TaxID=45882 RepID=A0A0V1CMR6_TRIBR|nr:hypothetical protein T03_6412 [Trichinella britovi]